MKRWSISFLVGVLVLAASAVSCSPKGAPVPVALAAKTATAAPQPAPAAATASAVDVSWARTVEAARKEGGLTIYSTSFVADTGRRLAHDFENQYGIRVDVLASGGSASLQKIKVEHQTKRPIADIMQSSAGSVTDLVMSGLALSVWQELPALKDKSVFSIEPIYSPSGELVQHNLYYTAPTINTRLVKQQDEPKSFKDLLDPRWKGNIGVTDPATTGSTAIFNLPLFAKALDMDYFRALAKQDVKLWNGSSAEAARMLARGEFGIFLSGTSDVYGPLIAEGAPLKMMDMAEGAGAAGHLLVAVKDSPHPNAAKLFINWMLTKDGQLSYTEPSRGISILKGGPDFSVPGTKLTPSKIWNRSWSFEEWSNQQMKAGDLAKIFGSQ